MSNDNFESTTSPNYTPASGPETLGTLPDLGPVAPNIGRELTFGEKAVGLNFNPGQNPAVHRAKQNAAFCIDQLNDLRNETTDPEVNLMCSTAITYYQTAQMWVVKAITWNQ